MATIDPDVLAIWRRRRQEKRCLNCGARTPRAALCARCRQTLRYCPRCEAVYDASRASQKKYVGDGRATSYCLPCSNRIRNNSMGRQTREAYLAGRQKHLQTIIRLYRSGMTYGEMARVTGRSRGALASLISYARKAGRWPTTLQRRRYDTQP